MYLFWGFNDFDFIFFSNFVNGSGLEIVKFFFVEFFIVFLVDSSFEFFFVNGWGIRLVVFFIYEVVIFKFGVVIMKFFDGFVCYGLDLMSFFIIGFVGWGEWYEIF